MSAVRQAAAGAAARIPHGGRPGRRAPVPAAAVLLPAAAALWAAGTAQADPAAIGAYGLLNALPVIWYAGLGLLVVSAGIELARARPSGIWLGLHAAALAVMLYGTAPLVYAQGRYAWLYKTVGVVQYVNAHGQLDRHIDIYQNWPGFFAFAAWLGKAAGITTPLAYAKWAQLVVELAALPLLRLCYAELGLTQRQRWAALLLYPAANWIAQDYFSPQAFGTLLSLMIFAIALRWLRPGPGRPAAQRAAFALLAAGVYWVLVTAHELSPYIVAVQLGALAVTGRLRPRWLPLGLAAIAVAYLLPRLSYVSAHYGLLQSVGSFFSNAAPPSFAFGTVPASETTIREAAKGLSAGMWALALAGAWRAWRARRSGRASGRDGVPAVALLLMTFSPVLVLAGQAYGNEGILRVYLFSLPWAAALAAVALVPARPRHRQDQRGVPGGHPPGPAQPGVPGGRPPGPAQPGVPGGRPPASTAARRAARPGGGGGRGRAVPARVLRQRQLQRDDLVRGEHGGRVPAHRPARPGLQRRGERAAVRHRPLQPVPAAHGVRQRRGRRRPAGLGRARRGRARLAALHPGSRAGLRGGHPEHDHLHAGDGHRPARQHRPAAGRPGPVSPLAAAGRQPRHLHLRTARAGQEQPMTADRDPAVTVITPAYNVARYVAEAAGSVLSQTYARFEYLVVDDQSTDDTMQVVKETAGHDSRVTIVPGPHRGLSAARNAGIAAARGRYLAFLDGDDRWHPRFLERQLGLIESLPPRVGGVFCRSRMILENGTPVFWQWSRPGRYDLDDLLAASNPARNGSSLLVRASCFADVGGFDEGISHVEDLEMWLRIAAGSATPAWWASRMC